MTPPSSIAFSLIPSPMHTLEGHPENAFRFSGFGPVVDHPLGEHLTPLDPIPAKPEALVAVHPTSYLEALRQACIQGPGYVDYAPTYVTPQSYECALDAAGGTLQVVQAIMSGKAE